MTITATYATEHDHTKTVLDRSKPLITATSRFDLKIGRITGSLGRTLGVNGV